MEGVEAVRDWNQRALVGAIVDLHHRTGAVRKTGRVETVHGDSSVSVRFADNAPSQRYRKTEWTMVLKIGRQIP